MQAEYKKLWCVMPDMHQNKDLLPRLCRYLNSRYNFQYRTMEGGLSKNKWNILKQSIFRSFENPPKSNWLISGYLDNLEAFLYNIKL